MNTLAVVGLQWGDEGKGKIVDLLSLQHDVIVRCQGGSNAGHTVVVNSEKYALHLVPSGILTPGKINVVANGVVIDPVALVEEIGNLRSRGVEVGENLLISDRAHVVFPYHKLLDRAQDAKRSGSDKIGTTGRGIGPAYADKYSRSGFRIGDLLDRGFIEKALLPRIEEKNFLLREYFGADEISAEETLAEVAKAAEALRPHVTDTAVVLRRFIAQDRKILFEGAQGALLDIDHGTYPYVTSSNTTAAGIPAGTGLPPAAVTNVLGVLKAYTTRVGAGPLPTELEDETGERLRESGAEYGATTGRPRRCGWFDAVVARHSVALNGCTGIALTKIDVLDGFETIKVATAYDLDGQTTRDMPASASAVERCVPLYEEVPGWKEDTSGIREWKDLPARTREYIARIEDLAGCRISMVSVGRERTAIITREGK
ncbi:MAG: adenylosuccinate synthase [Planctomycetes bacterium]|nr:adenylosuccinate synthase [Planctomycetota bacterium]